MPDWVAPPGALRVLIVEDEPAICQGLTLVLRRAGFEPLTALSAEAAEALLSDSIAAMLVDLRLPHARGDVFYFEAAARWPQLRRHTLFMTGDITLEAERLVQNTGCRLLNKPFHNVELVDALHELLADTSGEFARPT